MDTPRRPLVLLAVVPVLLVAGCARPHGRPFRAVPVAPPRVASGPTLVLSPTSGPVGTLVHVTGSVSGTRACPAVSVRVAADSATGAASTIVDALVVPDQGGADRGTFRTAYRVPDTHLTGRRGPQAVRASCERLDHHATNTGAEPRRTFTVTATATTAHR